jgi:hypothetical protein
LTTNRISNTCDPFAGSKSDNDILQSEGANGNISKGSNNDCDSSKIEDIDEKNKNIPLLDTHSCYIFDVVNTVHILTSMTLQIQHLTPKGLREPKRLFAFLGRLL